MASRYSSVLLAILVSQSVGFAASAAIVGVTGDPAPPPESFGWALLAGMCGVIGLGAFYRALARGTMGLVAPLSALIGAGVPALVGMLAGESVGPLRLLGIVVALVAVVLISLPSRREGGAERRPLRTDLQDWPLVVAAGLGFAGFFLFLDFAVGAGGGIWWSLLGVRLIGLVLVVAAVVVVVARAGGGGPLRRRTSEVLGVPRLATWTFGLLGAVPLLALAGAGDMGGNAFFVLANELSSLPVAAVLSSLYPVVTTILAALLLRERLRGLQVGGIALAVCGVALIGAGDAIITP